MTTFGVLRITCVRNCSHKMIDYGLMKVMEDPQEIFAGSCHGFWLKLILNISYDDHKKCCVFAFRHSRILYYTAVYNSKVLKKNLSTYFETINYTCKHCS